MATMQDVAALAGVSAKTVSRVFNDDPHVLPDTRLRVEDAMRSLNYVPNVLARTFRAGRSSSVGVAVPDVVDPFFASIVRAVESVCSAAGLTTLVTSIGDDPARERSVLEALLRTQLMGLVLAPVASSHAWLAPWTETTPIEFVDRSPVDLDADYFVEDDRDGSYLATRHLLDHGHTRVAFLADQTHPPSSRRRLGGYTEALADAGVTLDERLIAFDAGSDEGAGRELDRLSRLAAPPTAVFSSNARVTMHAFGALKSSGAAFVGFGDFPMADRLTPAVTVIDQDPAYLGRLAATRALDRFATPTAHYAPATVVPVALTIRHSCGCA
ncbi:LacI family DNA-binding transcriptional regulator [Herbiconiux sp. KACC 21604]|uniref:LacI family DNA-binding transcriptional regulator n=1 Tax=unclassified Herbiconiux TaxID=2618217 RepID=UPI0014919592|nr:LacI family DNA-binding transcriptional regulator [Herbiconiux sp. SALV-R1]QJU53132.1 LacI family DNA-binding transcriptional regulator [Herbiconiux sp. SALV-R1]WPO88073.1 LacI family DNA-binding transcriptional regulator [Herbiconiux sp. KACC 21604]